MLLGTLDGYAESRRLALWHGPYRKPLTPRGRKRLARDLAVAIVRRQGMSERMAALVFGLARSHIGSITRRFEAYPAFRRAAP